jgi:hypothetical protein
MSMTAPPVFPYRDGTLIGLLRGHGVDILAWYIYPHVPEELCESGLSRSEP